MKHEPSLNLLDINAIEVLLTSRYRWEDNECDNTALIATAVQGVADEQELAQANAHLATCAECRQAVLMLHGIEAHLAKKPVTATVSSSSDLDTPPQIPSPLRGGLGRSWRPLSAAAVVLLAIATIFVFLHKNTVFPSQSIPPDDGLTVKGTTDALFVAVKRGSDKFTARPLERLQSGDQLGFFYSAHQAGFLALFNIEERGAPTLLFPAGESRSASIDAVDRTPLTDGAIVRNGRGCEWVVALFSNTPLNLNHVARLLEGTDRKNANNTCSFTPKIPGARTVLVLPVRR